MKYKIIGFIFAFALFISLFTIKALAAGSWSVSYFREVFPHAAVVITSSGQQILLGSKDPVNSSSTTLTIREVDYGDSRYNGGDNFSWWPNGIFEYTVSYTNRNFTFDTSMKIIVLQGTFNITFAGAQTYPSINDYLNPPLSWYEELWNDFITFVDDNLISILTPFEISSIINLADWFEDAWVVKVGEGEDALALALASPTPAPTPIPIPTQIPYQTVMSPDGNGGYTINYIYNNPQGTPIITSSPPTQAIPTGSINISDNDFEYPYYENPDNKDNPFEFKIPWYLKLILNDNEIDIESLDANYKVAQSQVQSDNIMDAVSSIYDGFQILPSGWLLILGAIASLPLIAALIHRMLNG